MPDDWIFKDLTFSLLGTSRVEGERGGHGRVITTHKDDLCSFCLCDLLKKNVYCKHKHTNSVIPASAETLHVAGFERVAIWKDTFARDDHKLRKIHLEDIAHMELVSRSLYFSTRAPNNMEVVVQFTNCHIPEIPQQTFTQGIRSDDPRLDLNLEETRFLTLNFDRCHIKSIRSYALYNARLLLFNMTGTKVDDMEENSIHLDSYMEWIMEKSHLPNMIQRSICLRAQNVVEFSHNTFQSLDNRSLDILSSSQVLFEFNHVAHLRSEALLGIRPHSDARAANIVFLNNTIAKADEHSLLISRQYPMHERKIIDNKFNIICDCNVKRTFEKLLGISSMSAYDDYETFKVVTAKSLCQEDATARSFTTVARYAAQHCTLPIIAIVAGTSVGAVTLILVLVCLVCARRVRKARERASYLEDCRFSHSFSTLHTTSQPHVASLSQVLEPPSPSPFQPWVVAVPEVKTYKELELNVAYEHTEPMKVSLRDMYIPEPRPLADLQYNAQMRSSCPFN
ncbi:hypothetical protein GWK47_026234 [Chionoecetes opilio]|uniref:Uncharacterized protein n=1 Tax=Chionoecetes opilio TaxID=41210 RepID=A0A8J8WBR1_CHIOP|nr:hypothetical protein GWK47_026234 [Chionoecetes opilio]